MAYSGGTYWDFAHDIDAFFHVPSSFSDFLRHCSVGLPFALWMFAILAAHEMGHYVACRFYGIPATWPYFFPAPTFLVGTFGAVIRIRAPIPHRRALFDVAIAGPVAGLVVVVGAMVVGIRGAVALPEDVQAAGMVYSLPWLGGWLLRVLRPGETLQTNGTLGAAWAGFLVTALNLFPAGQLDGGHIAYAVSRRLHRWFSRGAIVLAATSVLWAFWSRQPMIYLIWLSVLCWMRDKHPPVLNESLTLDRARVVLAIVALILFVTSFTWFPLKFVG